MRRSPHPARLPAVNAICYSGYRDGQRPGNGTDPTFEQTREDLLLLSQNWKHLRLYDCGEHAETVLEVIREEDLDLQVMLGAYIGAEENNPGCPWGGSFSDEVLASNKDQNRARIEALIALTNRFPGIVSSVSAGNEATVDWTDHLVPVESVVAYVRRLKQGVGKPVTFCENYVPWLGKLDALAREVDFISVHTYPIWEFKDLEQAIGFTQENYDAVAARHPGKQVVITEAGWATESNGRGILPGNASEELQAAYYEDLLRWSRERGVLTFVFEAFDESWKGSPDPAEPEKHWGLFTVDRKPKRVMRGLYPEQR
jgi:exo-beta-1,3-glucanase (GH17 family)